MEHNLGIYSVSCHGFQNEICPHGGFRIEWDGTAGFGQLDIVFDEEGKAHLYTEYMCSQNDKLFALNAVKRMIDEAIVEE